MILYYNILDTLLYMFPGFVQLTINKQTTNKQNPTFRHDLFVAKESHSSMRNGSQIIQPKVRTKKYGLNYIRCQWSKRWNSLPPDMKLAASQSWLTNLLLKWYDEACSCSFCILGKPKQTDVRIFYGNCDAQILWWEYSERPCKCVETNHIYGFFNIPSRFLYQNMEVVKLMIELISFRLRQHRKVLVVHIKHSPSGGTAATLGN